MTKLLDSINGPQDLKGLSMEELEHGRAGSAQEVVDTITAVGGHFASNLGAVELTVALHAVFDSPWDKIVWDVGPPGVSAQDPDRAARTGWTRSASWTA